MTVGIEVRVPPTPEAAAAARRAVEGLLPFVEGDLVHDLRLIVSELVTNSVRHAGLGMSDHIRVRLEAGPEGVRGEVADRGRGLARPSPSPAPGRDGHWGLFLVESIADEWAVDRDGGTTVRFFLGGRRVAGVSAPS